MSNEIFDLYITKINRFVADHNLIQKEFALFLNNLIESNNMVDKFGLVKHVHIPYLSSEQEYSELGTCIAFVRLQKYNNHAEAAAFLWGKKFKGFELNAFKNNKPTKAISLKNAYVVNYNYDSSSDNDDNNNNIKKKIYSSSSSISSSSDTNSINQELMNENMKLHCDLRKERELRQAAELQLEEFKIKMGKMVETIKINDEKITQNYKNTIDLKNKVAIQKEELIQLETENAKLKIEARERKELIEQIQKMFKRF